MYYGKITETKKSYVNGLFLSEEPIVLDVQVQVADTVLNQTGCSISLVCLYNGDILRYVQVSTSIDMAKPLQEQIQAAVLACEAFDELRVQGSAF